LSEKDRNKEREKPQAEKKTEIDRLQRQDKNQPMPGSGGSLL
jgi:hypothetical protein